MNFGINKETYHQLFDDIYGDYYNPNLKVINYLDYYTKLSDTAINLLPNARREQYNINHFSYNSNTKTYDYKDSSIYFRFWKISDLFTDKNIIKELTTDKRYGNCHELSFKMSR